MYVVFFFKIVHNKSVDTIIRAVAREYQNFIRAVARGTRPPSLSSPQSWRARRKAPRRQRRRERRGRGSWR